MHLWVSVEKTRNLCGKSKVADVPCAENHSERMLMRMECTAVMLIGLTVYSCVQSVIRRQPHTEGENPIPETLLESEASDASGSTQVRRSLIFPPGSKD